MSPELQALVKNVLEAQNAAVQAAIKADPRLSFTQWRDVCAFAAIRAVAAATREATEGMALAAHREAGVFGAVAGPRIYSAMHAASVLGEALEP